MAIQYLRPIAAATTWDSWVASAGNKWDCVDAPDESTPNDATAIISGAAARFQGFQVTARNEMVSLDAYTTYVRPRKDSIDWTLDYGAAEEGGGYIGVKNQLISAFAYTTLSDATPAVTKANISASTFRLIVYNYALADAYISMLIGKMTYTPPAGGFAFLIGQYFAPFVGLLGANMLRREFEEACKLFSRDFVCTAQWEKDLFWDAYKSWPRSSYCFMEG